MGEVKHLVPVGFLQMLPYQYILLKISYLLELHNLFSFSFFNIILFISDCAGSLLLRGRYSSCSEGGLPSSCRAQAPHGCGFFCCGAWALGRTGSAWSLEHRLSSCYT